MLTYFSRTPKTSIQGQVNQWIVKNFLLWIGLRVAFTKESLPSKCSTAKTIKSIIWPKIKAIKKIINSSSTSSKSNVVARLSKAHFPRSSHHNTRRIK